MPKRDIQQGSLVACHEMWMVKGYNNWSYSTPLNPMADMWLPCPAVRAADCGIRPQSGVTPQDIPGPGHPVCPEPLFLRTTPPRAHLDK